MDKKDSYAGKISHAGVQQVKAPMPGPEKKGGSVVRRGTDLRTGKK